MKKYILFYFVLFSTILSAQTEGRYRVSFTDKNNSHYSLLKPEQFLSGKSIEKREKYNILITIQDVPVNSWYIDSVKNCGAQLCNTSKWFNSAVFVIDSTTNFSKIATFPFVKEVVRVAPKHVSEPDNTLLKQETIIHSDYSRIQTDTSLYIYGKSIRQIGLMNGTGLHKDGYMGQGMTIAVIDAGFLHVDSAAGFNHLWQNEKILGYKDFSGSNINVFEEGYHGMGVLSLIASFIPGKMIGTAPQANFLLLRSEEGASEYRVEEDNWIAAVEYADSVGVDVVSTSLGYSEFDDTTQNYTYSQVDGKTIRITRAAAIAANKGMLLFNSAGNSGNKPWRYITAPADADSIITVGACYIDGTPTGFTSRGPTVNGKLKPDVIALGHYPAIVRSNGLVEVSGMGTSFSNPILAGMSTCLWQEFPDATAQEIKQAILASSHRYFYPDTISGHGIPDFEKARFILRMNVLQDVFSKAKFYPNPCKEILHVQIESKELQTITIEIFDLKGIKYISKSIKVQTLINTFDLPEISNLPTGMYNAIITMGNEHQIIRVLKQE